MISHKPSIAIFILFFSILSFLSFALSGCVGLGQVESVTSLSNDEIRRLSQIKEYTTDEGLTYISLGSIRGLSCEGGTAMSASANVEGAMAQLRIKAVQLGGNGILYPVCSQNAGVDWRNNCFDSVVCVGEAIITE